jgi:cytidylate kinase
VSVFITASHDERVRRICERQNVDAEKAERMMERGDAERANYYNYYSTKTWGEAATYDLCINSSVMGIDETVAFIRHFVEKKLGGQ